MSLVKALAASCSGLTELSPSWYIDALRFLQQIRRKGKKISPNIRYRKCPKLELLSLQDTRLRPTSSPECVTRLLLCASEAARSLPELRIMEIWNTGPGYSYLFRYHYDLIQGRATITWRTAPQNRVGQEFFPTTEVIESWIKTVSKKTEKQLSVEIDTFPEIVQEDLETDGVHIYRHLLLSKLVFDPVTQEQLEALALH